MNLKYIGFTFLSTYLSFMVVQYMLGGFTLTKTASFVIVFWLLAWVIAVGAEKIRIFFLLPSILGIKILVHALLMWGGFWFMDSFIGGITIVPIQILSTEILGISVNATTLGSFGTIAVVSVAGATVYQTLIWLQKEK